MREEGMNNILDNLIFKQVKLLPPWRKGEARSPLGRLILNRVKRERKAVTPESYRSTPPSEVEHG